MTEQELMELSARLHKLGEDAAQHALMKMHENGMLQEPHTFQDALYYGMRCVKNHKLSESARHANRFRDAVDADMLDRRLSTGHNRVEDAAIARIQLERVLPAFQHVVTRCKTGVRSNSPLNRLRAQWRERGLSA